MHRGAYVGRAHPGPFHCLSCKAYVTGTESGHCPRCGFVPPSAPAASGTVLEPIRWTTVVIVAGIALALTLLLIR